jgi:crotonobetainyl-CoA:carnitine CoA-transferase CaiB-like acyl-CoA transferase
MLSHLRVVDCTDLRGALAGRLFADLGAAVTKVEPPGGDRGRWQPPFAGDIEAADRSLPFLYRNHGKQLVTLDLHDGDGARQFRALCDDADVLIENYGANRRQVLDLAPEAVRVRHPRLVHVVLADFGLSGPRAHWRAEPLVALAGSGALFATGFPEQPPTWLPGFAAHDCAAAAGVAGALIALLDRGRHGGGQTVEISVQEAAIAGLTPWSIPLADYARTYPMIPTAPPRAADGNYLVLPVADGHIRILPAGRRHWLALVELLGRPEAISGPEFEQPLFRMVARDVIRLVAGEALAGRSRAEVFAEARRRNIPLAPIQTPDEFVASEQSVARRFFVPATIPHLDGAPLARFWIGDAAPPIGASAAPTSAPANDTADQPPAGAQARATQASPLLSGTLVVVFGYAVVAPEAGTILAELGAEVVRIESHAGLDLLRQITIEPDTPNRAFTFNDASRGHKSVCLDIRQPRGRELALELCARADVVLENYRGGALRPWGLDYEAVRARRPDTIYLSSHGFGTSGPLAEVPAFGPLNSAYAGVHWMWSDPDTPYPAGASLNHPDHVASKLAAVAVLAALEQRRRSGAGQFLDLAQTEVAAFLIGEAYLATPCTGRPPQRGNASDAAVPHGVYPAAGDDQWIAVAVASDAAWQRLVRALGWPEDATLASLAGRRAARAAIDARLAEWTRTRAAGEAAATLQAAGVSALPVLGPDELRADPHLAARGAIVTLEHPEMGAERHIDTPLRFSRTARRVAGAAPLLGADTADVLTRVLGLSADEVRALIASGVCT